MVVSVLVIGDPHFQVNNVTETKELIDKINLAVDRLKPTFVVILGDLLHTHEKIHVTPFNLASKLITTLAEKVKVFLIIGNHDLLNNQQFLTSNHAFNSFKKFDNVTVCDRVIVKIIENEKFVFCPFVPPNRFEEALNTIKIKGKDWVDATCIFAHQEFYGCRFNPVMTSTEGDIWLKDSPLVVSGHIHDEQWLQDNIYYTGSSMQHAFGESANKTIAFFSFEKNKKFNLEKINLQMRKKKIIYLDIESTKNYKPPDNTLIKLVVKGIAEELKIFRKSKDYKDLQKLGIVISFKFDEFEKMDFDIEKVEKKNVLDILKDLVQDDNKYVKEAYNKLIN